MARGGTRAQPPHGPATLPLKGKRGSDRLRGKQSNGLVLLGHLGQEADPALGVTRCRSLGSPRSWHRWQSQGLWGTPGSPASSSRLAVFTGSGNSPCKLGLCFQPPASFLLFEWLLWAAFREVVLLLLFSLRMLFPIDFLTDCPRPVFSFPNAYGEIFQS